MDHLQALSNLIGSKYVLREKGDMARYEQGARYSPGMALCVVRPADTAQVSQILTYCHDHRIGVVPQGANTGLTGASVPDQSGKQIVLSLERLSQIFEIDVVNKTATVGAGVLLWDLNKRVEEHGLFFPIDLGSNPSIGGMVSTNTGGSKLIKYGDVRRNVLGLEVALADGKGTVLNLMNGLRKNNTGLDLKQVFIGTGGTFGVVTKAVVMLSPLPRYSASALVVPRQPEDSLAILLAAEAEFGSLLSSFEGMSKNAMEAAIKNIPSVSDPFNGVLPDYALLMELSSQQDENLEDKLHEFVMRHYSEGGQELIVNAVTGRPERIWALRHGISEGLRHKGHVIGMDVSVMRSQLWPFKRKAAAMVARDYPFLTLCDFGHVGDGSDHFNMVWPKDAAQVYSSEIVKEVRGKICEILVREFGGSFSAEHGIGPANQDYYHLYVPAAVQAVAGAFKTIFDPRDVLGNIRLSP